ncbi:MAG: DUF3365 domain-containing protein [Pseudomonadota bacterium]
MKLSLKFNLILVVVLVIGAAITAYFTHSILQSNARSEVADRAAIMMESAISVRGYTVGEVRPLIAPHMQDTFYPQTVPAYAATQTFNKLREKHPEYTYKEAALNPTNPRDQATGWETDLIQQFRNYPDETEIIGERSTPSGDSLFIARPIQIKNKACLACHSTPDKAPATMIKLYGDSNGFGWKHNEIIGAQIVSVPMSVPIQHANNAFLTFFGFLMAVFIAIVIVLNIMLHFAVIKPITQMAKVANEVSTGDMRSKEFSAKGKDEVSVLERSFNRMRRSLQRAMKMLDAGTGTGGTNPGTRS